jgi:hypothetical protein
MSFGLYLSKSAAGLRARVLDAQYPMNFEVIV